MKNNNSILITIVLGICILIGAWYFQVFTDYEVPSRILAAILGVVITAIITQLLLSSQTNKEVTLRQEQQKWQAEQDKLKQDRQKELAKETREWQEQQALKTKEWQEQQDKKTEQWRIDHDRSNTVFCEKLKIYKNFLDTLYDVVKDRKLTEDEKLQLEYKTSLVAMHCKPANLDSVSAAVRNVISSVCPSDEAKKQKSQGNIPLLESLLGVVEALKIDLYNVDVEKDGNMDDNDLDKMLFSSAIKTNTINNFQKAYVETAEKEDAESKDTWSQAVKKWQSQGWEVKALESEDCPLQITRNDGNPGKIDMGFYNGHYYLQAGYEGDGNFSKCLKWDNGGRRQYDLWYEFPTLSMDVPQGGFIDKFKSSLELQQYIIKKVNYLIEVIKKEHRTIQWMKAVGEHKDWQIFTWYWSTLACQWQNDEEGKVYMDTMPDDKDSSKVIVKLGNRANNVEMLKKTLERIGHADKINAIDTTDNCYVTIATIDSLGPDTEANTVAGKLKELIKDISLKNIK